MFEAILVPDGSVAARRGGGVSLLISEFYPF